MISIQQAHSKDSNLITSIATRSFIESHGHSAPANDIDSYVSSRLNLDRVQGELMNENNIFHIIYYNEQPAGYSKIILNTGYPLIKEPNVTKLERLYLLKDFYDRKLGVSLFNFILQLSKKANQSGMWLYVWKENERAVKFYKKAGFEIIDNADFKISVTHSNPNYIMFLKY